VTCDHLSEILLSDNRSVTSDINNFRTSPNRCQGGVIGAETPWKTPIFFDLLNGFGHGLCDQGQM
jgi:hypothetical protein